MSQTRRLAAILAADVAGYSRLIGADEQGTLNRLRAIRTEIVDPSITQHRVSSPTAPKITGPIVSTALTATGSRPAACRCAFQRSISARASSSATVASAAWVGDGRETPNVAITPSPRNLTIEPA
jgi:class 3 adenylate cyclase